VRPDRNGFTVSDMNWIAGNPFDGTVEEGAFELKIRHGPHLARCRVRPEPRGRYHVVMDPPDPGIATGQFAILYRRDECLGGGLIESVHHHLQE
jgi:tRNA-specific 2-thiouridylase